jgi:hypothetical protein
MLNILALKNYGDYMSVSKRHIFDLFEYLKINFDYKEIDIQDLLKDNVNEYLISKFGTLPDNILILDGSSTIFKMKLSSKIKISVIIDDIHHQGLTKKNRQRSLKKVTNIFSTYGYFFRNKFSFKNSVYFWPHSVRYDCTYNSKPIRKILVSGRLNENIYPNRQTIFNLSQKNKRICYLSPNVGYREKKDSLDNTKIFGEKFVKHMSKFLCCFTCDANPNRPYIVAKHFEILSSGSLLLSCNENTKKYFEILGFIDNVHYISCTKDNIIEKINFILNSENLGKINEIRYSGYNFAKINHFYLSRGKYINNILMNNYDADTHANEYGNFKYLKME